MENKEKKRIMTDLAKGKISRLEAESLIGEEKTQPDKPISEFEGKDHTHKRKIKSREVK